MQTSKNGLTFIKVEEGFAATPTNDNGHVMWGHGHDRQGAEPIPASITFAEADALLVHDCAVLCEPHVSLLAPWANQNQFDALVDFCYNLGPGALATMLHHGQAQVPVQMLAWRYEHVDGVVRASAGLAARRAKEVALYGA